MFLGISKPSEALQAMVDGLLEAEQMPYFKINMMEFGTALAGICYGCAATCTLQKLIGEQFPASRIKDRAYYISGIYNVSWERVWEFEKAMDYARQGVLYYLFSFFNVTKMHKEEFSGKFKLWNADWKAQLPAVRELIKELEELNL